MALLHEIQRALLDENASIGIALLKLRFLAVKLGSDVLDEWVKHETEGYPAEVSVPEYRKLPISYSAIVTNGYWIMKDVAVASALVKKHAGPHWVEYEFRSSMAVIDEMVAKREKSDRYEINTGNLLAVISNKIFK